MTRMIIEEGMGVKKVSALLHCGDKRQCIEKTKLHLMGVIRQIGAMSICIASRALKIRSSTRPGPPLNISRTVAV